MPENDLDTVIRAVLAGEAGPAELLPALGAATLFLAIDSGVDGSVTPWVADLGGTDHGVVFTSAERAEAVEGVPGYAELPGRELGARWPDGLPVALNPGTPEVGVVLDDVAMHEIGGTPEVMTEGTEITVSAPDPEPPAEFVEALRAGVRARDDVDAALLFDLATAGEPKRLVIGVLLAGGTDRATVVADFAAAVAEHAPGLAEIDFAALTDEVAETVGGVVPAIS